MDSKPSFKWIKIILEIKIKISVSKKIPNRAIKTESRVTHHDNLLK